MAGVDICPDPESIFHRAQGEYFVDTDPGKSGLSRSCTGREDQLIVAFFKRFAGFQIPNRNRLPIGVDRRHLVTHFHDHPEPCKETLRGLQCQFCRISNHTTDIIWQTTVGVGYISRTLKHNDLRLFI